MLLFLIGSAFAFDLVDDGDVVTYDEDVTSVLVADVDSDGTPEVVVAAAGVTAVVGSTDAAVTLQTLALALADLDGDDLPELLGCTNDGLYRLDLGAGVEQLTTKPCSAIAAADLDDDGDDDVVTAGTSVLLWEAVDGTLEGPTDFGQRLGGTALVSATDGTAVAAELSDSLLWSMDLEGASDVDVELAIGGLLVTADGALWVSTSPPDLHLPSGDTVGLQSGSTLLFGADWDGDGLPELAILQAIDGLITLVDAEELAVVGDASIDAGDRLPSQVSFADADGDGCPDLAIALGTDLSFLRGDCPELDEPDRDSDGWTTQEGDCDDDNADIHPGATEACNDIDDDCDGEIDEYSLELSDDAITNNEGGKARIRAYLGGCVDHTEWQSDDPDGVLLCARGDEDGITCDLLDDGEATVSYVVRDADESETDRRDVAVTVTNVSPAIVDIDGKTHLRAGDLVALNATAIDLGERDPLAWSLEGAPAGMSIFDGEIRWQSGYESIGTWAFTVRVDDDDGGHDEEVVELHLSEPTGWADSVCCCAFGATAGVFLPLTLLASARRRRVDATAIG